MIMENNFLNDKNIEDHFKIMDPFSPKINGRDKNFQNNPFLPQDFHNDEKIQDNCFNLENDTNEIPHDFLNNLNKNQNFGKQKAKKKSFKNTPQETNGLLPKKRERSHKKGLSMT